MAFKNVPVIVQTQGQTVVTVESLRTIYLEFNVKGWSKQAQGLGVVLESIERAMKAEGWKR